MKSVLYDYVCIYLFVVAFNFVFESVCRLYNCFLFFCLTFCFWQFQVQYAILLRHQRSCVSPFTLTSAVVSATRAFQGTTEKFNIQFIINARIQLHSEILSRIKEINYIINTDASVSIMETTIRLVIDTQRKIIITIRNKGDSHGVFC